MSIRQFIATRFLLRSYNIVKDNAVLAWKGFASLFGLEDDLYYDPRHKKPNKPVTAILIGAGHRGKNYASYADKFPDELTIVSVADTNPERRKRMARAYNIPEHLCFSDWTNIFTREKFADAVIIATPDDLHTQPCLAALDAGYDILLEKPIAPTENECRLILQKAK